MVKKIILWILVISCMLAIFGFSSQPANASDGVSQGLLNKIIDFLKSTNIFPVFSNRGAEITLNFDYAHHIIRKMAHFSIFACLGFLIYNLMRAYGVQRRKILVYASLICLLYAISDEIHQFFVPGRACRLKDVLIDFCGSFSVIGTTYLLFGRRFDKQDQEVEE